MTQIPPHDDPQERLVTALTEWFTEAALEKRRARDREEKQQSETANITGWGRFWSWVGARGTAISILFPIVVALAGGFWTVQEYLRQEKIRLDQKAEEAHAEAREQIARFALDLADPSKRNSAAYALATLGREEALPLLAHHLVEAARRNDASDFRSALASALITIGKAGLDEALRLNREAISQEPNNLGSVYPIVDSTQTVIVHFLLHQPELARSGGFDGIRLLTPPFSYADLSAVKLRDGRFEKTNLCGTSFRGADLSRTRIDGTRLGSVDLSESQLDGVRFLRNAGETNGLLIMSGAKFERARGADVEFSYVDLSRTNFRDAKLPSVKLQNALLVRSEMTNANLEGADLTGSDLTSAILSGASLRGSVLFGANLYKANVSGAHLDDAVFGTSAAPFDPTGTAEGRAQKGAFVLDADFNNATGLSEDVRNYLCRYGARNVPRGCDGIQKEQIDPPDDSGGGSSCF